MANVLDGVRVLDFGRYIAGPWCAALLGDFGADVIRVDKPGGSEDRRVLPAGSGLEGSLFTQVNRNKRSLTLAGRGDGRTDIVRRLVASADVVVANMPDKALQALEIDYDSLVAIKPDIILTSVTAFGTQGPFADKVGFDVVAQAMSGAMHLTGHPGEPMRSAVPWVDFGTATLCALGTMAALFERKTSGKGQHVSGSLLATSLMTANSFLVEQALTGADRVATGNRSQLAGPADLFATKDGFIVMQAIGPPMFGRWAKLIGREDLIADPRFADDETRAEHGEVLSGLMQAWCVTRSNSEALAELESARIPGAQTLTPREALDHPHIKAGGFFTDKCCDHSGRAAPVVNTPVRLSRTPGEVRTPSPANGVHSAEILTELGYDGEEIEAFVSSGLIEL